MVTYIEPEFRPVANCSRCSCLIEDTGPNGNTRLSKQQSPQRQQEQHERDHRTIKCGFCDHIMACGSNASSKNSDSLCDEDEDQKSLETYRSRLLEIESDLHTRLHQIRGCDSGGLAEGIAQVSIRR